jgi:hypothetical protein
MDNSTGFVVPALAGLGRLKAGLHASSVSSMSRSPQKVRAFQHFLAAALKAADAVPPKRRYGARRRRRAAAVQNLVEVSFAPREYQTASG